MKRIAAVAVLVFALFTTPALAISSPDEWFPEDGWAWGVPGTDGIAITPIVTEEDILGLDGEMLPNPCLGMTVCGDEGTGEVGVCSTWCIALPTEYSWPAMMTLEETYEDPYTRECDLVSDGNGMYWDEYQQDWMYPENHTNFTC